MYLDMISNYKIFVYIETIEICTFNGLNRGYELICIVHAILIELLNIYYILFKFQQERTKNRQDFSINLHIFWKINLTV